MILCLPISGDCCIGEPLNQNCGCNMTTGTLFFITGLVLLTLAFLGRSEEIMMSGAVADAINIAGFCCECLFLVLMITQLCHSCRRCGDNESNMFMDHPLI